MLALNVIYLIECLASLKEIAYAHIMSQIVQNSTKPSSLRDAELSNKISTKIFLIAYLLRDIAGYEKTVKKLKNHFIKSYWFELCELAEFASDIQMEVELMKNIPEIYDDFKRSRNIELKTDVTFMYEKYLEVVSGNYDISDMQKD